MFGSRQQQQGTEAAQRGVQEAGYRLESLKQRMERELVAFTYNKHDNALQLQQEPFDPNCHVDQAKWVHAREVNPNPRFLHPTPLRGFRELVDRVQHQEQGVQMQQKMLEEMRNSFANMKNHQQTHTKVKLQERKDMQVKLQKTLLEVMSQLEVYAASTGAARQNYQRQHVLEGRLSELEEALTSSPAQFSLRISELTYLSKLLLENLSRKSGKKPSLSAADANKVVAAAQTQGELLEQAAEELRRLQRDVAQLEAAVQCAGA